MHVSLATLLLLGSIPLAAPGHAGAELPAAPEGILQSIANARTARDGDALLLTRADPEKPIQVVFTRCEGLGIVRDAGQWWVLPLHAAGTAVAANTAFWVLPVDPASPDHSWRIQSDGGQLHAVETSAGITVTADAGRLTLSQAEARPHSDPLGRRFSLTFPGAASLEETLAAFYWGTMLPSVVEKTMAAGFPYHDGYVLSTLDTQAYAGSYPAVDHEFQIRGRLAIGSAVDRDIVKRMIALDGRLMNGDPERLFRMPTSVQPDGRREYHIRRNSEDDRQNAAMFPLTGDIELIEDSWLYYEATQDMAWLRSERSDLEHAAGWVSAHTDPYGRVWSDVYYEDQVIKDGRVTQAQAFAAHAFTLLAAMEDRLGRRTEAAQFAARARRMESVLAAPLPLGYWNPATGRFVDWVDRNGNLHDHIHLLANELPVLFGYASPEQAMRVRAVLDANAQEFERFPSFVAARIADYDRSEIGSGGPYDLCAAGRYWYWDAAYRESQKQYGVVWNQLNAVAAEAAKSGYFMSERYDMDHVYYVDGKDAHGADRYYEYPNVFAAVLIQQLLGLTTPADADVSVAPRLVSYGAVQLDMPAYALRYVYTEGGFSLQNLSDETRTYDIDLSALRFGATRYARIGDGQKAVVGVRSRLTLVPHGQARWTPLP